MARGVNSFFHLSHMTLNKGKCYSLLFGIVLHVTPRHGFMFDCTYIIQLLKINVNKVIHSLILSACLCLV